MTSLAHPAHERTAPRPIPELIGAARRAIAKARDQAPAELTSDVDRAERAVARLRNRLIDSLRADDEQLDRAALRQALDQANVAISLLAGVEYPAGGVHRRLLDQAAEVLERLEQQGIRLGGAREES